MDHLGCMGQGSIFSALCNIKPKFHSSTANARIDILAILYKFGIKW